MTEIIQSNQRRNLRYRLLLSVSSAAALAFAGEAQARDDARPTVWIELGGAFDQINRDSVEWVPPNLTDPISNPSPEPFGKTPAIGYDANAAIEVRPHGSDWIFDASVRYGRAQRGPKHFHDQTYKTKSSYGKYSLTTYAFLNATAKSRSTHAIVDFNVGRDVGLGSSSGGRSTIHFGVRMAQLNERAEASLTAFSTAPAKYSTGKSFTKPMRLWRAVTRVLVLPFPGTAQHRLPVRWKMGSLSIGAQMRAFCSASQKRE
jgi:hypothetical protein